MLTKFNTRLENGDAYYLYALILEALEDYDTAYDYYYKAFWAADTAARAMTRIAVIDIRRKDYEEAVRHAVKISEVGDIVFFAGKGHETYQYVKGKKVPFIESDIIRDQCALTSAENQE